MAERGLVGARADARRMLTRQETRVMELLIEGRRDKEIASILGLSPRTVTVFIENACDKLNTRTRIQAAVTFDRMRAAWP